MGSTPERATRKKTPMMNKRTVQHPIRLEEVLMEIITSAMEQKKTQGQTKRVEKPQLPRKAASPKR
jgi:hypothetical protein